MTPPPATLQPRRRKRLVQREQPAIAFAAAVRQRQQEQIQPPTTNEMFQMIDEDAKYQKTMAETHRLPDGSLDVSKSVVLTEEQQQLVTLMVAVMENYDAVITATQGVTLNPDFADIIYAFGGSYHKFCRHFYEWKPMSASNVYRDVETPKIHVILNQLVKYLTFTGEGMSRLSEQNFEAVYSRFKKKSHPAPASAAGYTISHSSAQPTALFPHCASSHSPSRCSPKSFRHRYPAFKYSARN